MSADAAAPTDKLDEADAGRLHEARAKILEELGKIIVGQEQVVNELMIWLFSRGHVMLEGVPGLAKTLMISTLAKTLDLTFSRIQFTPDLMPADVTGTEIIEEDRATGHRDFRFMEGPLFANVVLADEINRTPPKTQAALLEAMQERQVTVGRTRHPLSDPFFVLATQNPIEQEGTYPLPEAQQDRFMFKVYVEYPSFDEEFEVARRTTGTRKRVSSSRCWGRKRSCGCSGWCVRCRSAITWCDTRCRWCDKLASAAKASPISSTTWSAGVPVRERFSF